MAEAQPQAAPAKTTGGLAPLSPEDAAASFAERYKAEEAGGGEGEGEPAPAPAEPVAGDEAEPEPEEEPEEEEEEAPAEEEPPLADDVGEAAEGDLSATYPVTVDGQVKEVPVADLVRSYQQQADYTRRTQAFSEERRAFNDHRERALHDFDAVGAQLDVVVPALAEMMRSQQMPAAELNRLRAEDPASWSAYMHEQRQRHELLQSAQQARAQTAEARRIEEERARLSRVPSERAALIEAVPQFRETNREKSPEGFNFELYDEVGKFAINVLGYKPEEWDKIIDHRDVRAVYWARRGYEADRRVRRAAKSGRLSALPKPMRPGSPQARPTQRETQRQATRGLVEKVASTGKVSDAAAAFTEMYRQGA